ncbi:hypothetical protein M427DRAFT_325722 [Gonapodya prolifera JEL478]|uniref:DUF1254 domain-containing protein n=1 Tax=Gonapodya prolifera (strain JEL478) TaxID=1344416 RepID=A0A139AGD3_GONPJ|nr:hypothetical protein M427DRAFT_325722 [Gonapodya prolifera JEL478]|eukprot:KXS15473.1 hypothetical protein M427DRAFT_325722 [Gonapodya prolifera JEL478]
MPFHSSSTKLSSRGPSRPPRSRCWTGALVQDHCPPICPRDQTSNGCTSNRLETLRSSRHLTRNAMVVVWRRSELSGSTQSLPTLTSLALMDLTKGPVRLEVPEWLHNGYYVIGLHSPWNDCPVTLGSRTNKNENNVHVFVGPGFHSCIQTLTPQSMAMTGESWNLFTIVRVPSNQYLLYARILAKSKHYSLAQVRELQQDFNIVQLDKHPSKAAQKDYGSGGSIHFFELLEIGSATDATDLSTTALVNRAITSHAIPFKLPVPECAEY